MKENTKQILKVSICTLMALVLFAGVILMCIYFAFDTTSNGVADAYTDEEVGVINNDFTVDIDDGIFYINDLWERSNIYIENLLNYYFYFIPDLMVPNHEIDTLSFSVGDFYLYYVDTINYVSTYRVPLTLTFYQDYDTVNVSVIISDADDLYLFDFYYNFVSKEVSDFMVNVPASSLDGCFGVAFDTPFVEGTFPFALISSLDMTFDEIVSIDSIRFQSDFGVNFGIFFSPNQTFANPPVVMPEGVYDFNLQDSRDEGYDEGYDSGHYLGYVEGHDSGYETGYDAGVSSQQTTIQGLQNQITELQNQITEKNTLIEQLRESNNVLHDNIDYYVGLINDLIQVRDSLKQDKIELQSTIDELQQTIDELRAQVAYYKTFYDASNWFNFIDSSYYNVKPAVYGNMKTTIKSTIDIGNGIVGVMLMNDSGTGQGLIGYLDFGSTRAKGDLVRFSWKDLRIEYQTGSSGPGGFLPVHIAILSDGALIDCFVTTEDMMIDGSCEFTLPSSADGIYLYNSDATTYIFVSGMIGQYYSYDSELIYDNGFDAGYNDGRDDGIQYGEQVGYENGYADARDYYMNNDFSFFALFSSVLDAPLQMIIGTDEKPGMLNFYIPGLDINIAPFLLSLFSVALVITVIRFILARAS